MKHLFLLIVITCFFASCRNNKTGKGDFEGPKDELGLTPYDYVNPFIGTGGDGHTYPGAVVPFGMVQLSPDTEIKHYSESYGWCSGYRYEDSTIMGFSHTHFSGTGHSDLGDLLIMPDTGDLKFYPGATAQPETGYRSRFSHQNESAKPGYYSVLLDDCGVKAELTATKRAGFHKYTFPASGNAHFIIDLVHSIYNYEGKVIWSSVRFENDTLITGYRQTRGWAENRTLYFAIAFSKPMKSYCYKKDDTTTYHYKYNPEPVYDEPAAEGRKIRLAVLFDAKQNEEIGVKVGISSVSTAGAMLNLRSELPLWNFDKVRKQAKLEWERVLSAITVKADRKTREIFYTSLYHTMLAPSLYMDADRKYRGLDQQVHTAADFENYTVFSLWDTYRAAHPLFTITQPMRDADMINSMLAHYEQSVNKLLPVWSFHYNETWCMIGYHAVPVIADACMKNIKGVDYSKAWEAIYASSNHISYDGLGHYIEKGYIPIDLEDEAVSKVLEYAYDDYTIAQMARKMGKKEEYNIYRNRAGFYKNVFDKETGFMRAKLSDGSWRVPFDPLYAEYGGDYTEGNAWQYSWYVPHDPAGLISLMGGRDQFVQKLDSLFVIEVEGEEYDKVEDISGLIGQYAHGNEPSQHIAYLYNYAGMPWKTQEHLHQVMNHLFDNTPYGICGNEDCGQMSAWYIFSSMGFYPVCPGSNVYVIGTPTIEQASIRLEGNKTFDILVKNHGEGNFYIQSVTLNGKAHENNYIRHEDIMKGGKLEFVMGKEPNKSWASKAGQMPPSMSDEE